jgi:hypothetical protein
MTYHIKHIIDDEYGGFDSPWYILEKTGIFFNTQIYPTNGKMTTEENCRAKMHELMGIE